MDCSEEGLDRIEAQRSKDVSQEQWRQSYIPMNLIRILSSRSFLKAGGEGTRETKPVPDFLTNLKLSDFFDLHGEYVPMSPEIFSALRTGNKECLKKLRSYGTPMSCLKSDQGDSVLHLAASWGHLELVKRIVCGCPCLLLEPDSRDRLPLHLAARAGHLHVVKALVATITFLLARLSEDERESLNPYVLKDKDGDTALHMALTGSHLKIASCLVKADQRTSFLANKDGKSPLYLAIEVAALSLVKKMLKTTSHDDLEGRNSTLKSQLEGRKYLVHVALKGKSTDVIDVILKEDPSLEDERDEEGMTCLSFGASIGYYEGVCNLLDRSTKSVYVCNDDGSFPIHIAVEKCHRGVITALLNRCPDSKHLLNKQGQNILHVAAKSSNATPFLCVLLWRAHRVLEYQLVEEQDVDGNTPLHLATTKWRPRALFYLFYLSKEKCLHIRNNSGLTPMDIAKSSLQPNYIFMERVTLMILICFYDTRGSLWMLKTRSLEPLDPEKNREYVNTLLLVAALVATVTFAAGFTIPGGFNSSAPNLGMATLAHDRKLVYFMVFDTLAMQSSVLTIATLIWAQLGDPSLVQRALNIALPSLFFALLGCILLWRLNCNCAC